MKDTASNNSPKSTVISLAQLLAEQPASPPPGWIEPGLLPPQGILFVGGEPKVGKSLLVANLALALAARSGRAGFTMPDARSVLVCQFELPVPQLVSRLATMRRTMGTTAVELRFQFRYTASQPSRMLQLDPHTLWFSAAGLAPSKVAERKKVEQQDVTQALAGLGEQARYNQLRQQVMDLTACSKRTAQLAIAEACQQG